MKNTFLKLITALLIMPFACNPKEEIAPTLAQVLCAAFAWATCANTNNN